MNGYSDPELLDARHIVAGFDCGNETLSSWLTTRSLRNQAEGSSRTWVVTDPVRVVAFYQRYGFVRSPSMSWT